MNSKLRLRWAPGPTVTLITAEREPLACILYSWTYKAGLRIWNSLPAEVVSQKALALSMDFRHERLRDFKNTVFQNCREV